MKKTALIMAGGKGERFWPRSRVNLPKQFLSLTDDGKTMIQLTVERISPLVDIKDVYIATNANYKELVKQQLPGLPEENILCEPIGRNTAPCIGLGAVHVASKYDDAVMIVLPSDHLIKHNDIFKDTFVNACDIAEKGENLVTVGITPNYPETGYGYIKYIMEKASDIYTLAGNFGWDDVGSWLAVGRIKENDSEGNVVNGNVVTVNTQNCVIEGADKLIATVGLRDMIVVDTKDATLISTKENAGEIKKVLAKLREEGKNQYL